MNWFEIFPPWMAAPALLCLLMAACLWAVWGRRRAHRYLLWQSASLVLLAFALVNLWSVLTLWLGAWMAAQAIALRFGQSVHWKTVGLGSVVMGLWLAACWGWPMLAPWRAWGITLGLALVLGHVIPRVGRSAARHSADQWLRHGYAVLTVSVLLLPAIADPDAHAVGSALLPLMVSANFVWCARQDRAIRPRRAHYRDVSTQLLNRAGLDAVNTTSLLEQGITMVMLCEFQATTAAMSTEAASTQAQQAFAQLLQNSIRAGDWVARTASEEYVIALRGMDRSQSQALVARIRTALAATSLMQGHSLCIGVAQVQAADSLEKAIHRADVALYQAKEDGLSNIYLAGVM